MSRKKIDFPRLTRRRFLGTAGVSALAYPFIRKMNLGAHAQGEQPKRLILMFSPNGTIPNAWGADGSLNNFTLKRILRPLDAVKDKIMVVGGIDIHTDGLGDAHQQGMGTLWTGADLNPGDTKGGCDTCPAVSWANGISIDQHLAPRLRGNNSRLKSVELAVKPSNGVNIWTRMIYGSAGNVLPPEASPYRAFSRLFDNLPDPTMPEPIDNSAAIHKFMMDKSVLDSVKDDFAKLSAQLSSPDQQLLDKHLTAVRDIESRLQDPRDAVIEPPPTDYCMKPNMGGQMDINADANYPEMCKLQMDILAMAFACDLTRVGSLQWSRSVGNVTYPWLGVGDRHHDMSHEGDSNNANNEKLIKVNVWYAEMMRYMIDALAAIPEGDGSVLDNTLIVWGNELGKGNSHTRKDVPIVMAGGGNIGFQTGRYVQANTMMNDVLMTIAHGFGDPVSRFGEARHSSGPISDLLT